MSPALIAAFTFSGVAFWAMPRGQTSLGLPQVAILPLTGNSLDDTADFDSDE